MTAEDETAPSIWDNGFDDLLRPHLPKAAERPLRADDRLAALGLDSMETIQVLLDIEQAYDIAFPDELLTADTFATVGSLWAAVSSVTGQVNDGASR